MNVASQATAKSWPERNGQFQRLDQRKNPDHRNFSQVQCTLTGKNTLATTSAMFLNWGIMFMSAFSFPDIVFVSYK